LSGRSSWRSEGADGEWELVHRQPPAAEFEGEPRQRADGTWVYRTLKARELWQQIMESTYAAERVLADTVKGGKLAEDLISKGIAEVKAKLN
jgi:hypothetical protein